MEDDVEHSNTGNFGRDGNQNAAQLNSEGKKCFNFEANDSDENVEEDYIESVDRSGVSYGPDDKFEEEWTQLLERFGLENNAWCKSLYNKKTSWAETFLRDHYFGGMTTTSRCESMNSLLKGKVEKDMSLVGIVKALDRTLSWLRHREAKEDFESLHTSPVLGESNMLVLEKQAASIYTRRMFNRVRHQIKREGKYRVTPDSRCDDLLIFKLTKYGEYSSKRSVLYNTVTGEFKCQCNYFPTNGIPCRHMFAVMKEMNVTEIPDCLIQWQWTMHAREKLSKVTDIAPRCNKSCSEESARFGYMNNLGAQMAYYSAKSETLFKMGEEMMLKSIASLKSSWEGVGDKTEENVYNYLFIY
ncbi:FHY3/FAR1 family [Trema orientale]|uniref:Protein FAR1-RELATED SEQUENCE n=1 Tax=Trema orientale TaxID=63057 RepID=A0A2P5CL86_TREOI|nr:FHY3/FAR1 family [Trema orientale]